MDNPNDIENLVKALELSFSEGTAIPYMEEEEVLSVLDYYIGQDNLEHLTRIMDIGLEQHPGSSTILLYKANFLKLSQFWIICCPWSLRTHTCISVMVGLI